MPSKTWVLYLSDEIFALQVPILVTIEARSTTILNIALAAERSAATWKAHFEALEQHHFVSLGMAADRGLGLMAGSQAACDLAWGVAEYFHEFRDLCEVLQQLERNAYAAMAKEYEAARTFAHATSAATLQQRLQQYASAHDAWAQAITRSDQLALRLALRREALHLCSPHGTLRTQENVRSDLTRLFDMSAALDCAAITQTLQSIRKQLDDLLVPCKQAEVIAAALRLVVPHDV
jgi:hypothetical protein